MSEEVRMDWFVKTNNNHFWKQSKMYMKYDHGGGDYNGYIVCHKSHPWFGMYYNEVPVNVHGGLTFGCCASDCNYDELDSKYKNKNYYVYGFDTMHYNSYSSVWTKQKTEEECRDLYSQFYWKAVEDIRIKKKLKKEKWKNIWNLLWKL